MSSVPGACGRASRTSSKFALKEPVIPDTANKGVFLFAPFVMATLGDRRLGGDPGSSDGWAVADINVGVLYIFALSSLGVYGVIMGGWASNSKYPFLSALRVGGANGVLRSLDRLRHHHRSALRRLAQSHRHRAARRTPNTACSAGIGCASCRCS